MPIVLLVLVGVLAAGTAGGFGPASGHSATTATPGPLRGIPLVGSTGLRLLVANNPPFLLDVDTEGAGSRRPLTLWDLRVGGTSALPWPSQIGGRDEAAVHSRSGSIALAFSDPAYQGGGEQVTDLWQLEPSSRRFQQLPDMPAIVSLKFTSMQWSSDGRLVMLAETQHQDVVAVWRPGQERIAVKRVRLPLRNSGSDSFVAW